MLNIKEVSAAECYDHVKAVRDKSKKCGMINLFTARLQSKRSIQKTAKHLLKKMSHDFGEYGLGWQIIHRKFEDVPKTFPLFLMAETVQSLWYNKKKRNILVSL